MEPERAEKMREIMKGTFERLKKKGVPMKYQTYEEMEEAHGDMEEDIKEDTEIKPDPKKKEEYRLFKRSMPIEEQKQYNQALGQGEEEIKQDYDD
jgi:TPP-dependent indolepyruvate ferredoxin oxidoreductase alpha subunit